MKLDAKKMLLVLAIFILIMAAFLFFLNRSNQLNVNSNPSSGNAPSGSASYSNNSASNSTSPGNFPSSTGNSSANNAASSSGSGSSSFKVPSKDDPKMKVEAGGTTIEMNNLYKNPVETLPQNGVAFIENNQYHMSFYPQNNGFLITIIDPDIQAARNKAENDFLDYLGITKDQACKLTVDLGMPAWVNSMAAGVNYGLSFCPNGKPFPAQ